MIAGKVLYCAFQSVTQMSLEFLRTLAYVFVNLLFDLQYSQKQLLVSIFCASWLN